MSLRVIDSGIISY